MRPFAMHPNLQAAIVDLDGTMVDTLGDFSVALNAMLQELYLPTVSSQQVERFVGKGSEYLVKSVLALVSKAQPAIVSEALYTRAWRSYQSHYERINGQHAQVYPGVLAGLEQLQARGLKLACLTNKPTAYAEVLLKSKGLDGFFECTHGGDFFERKKPDPLPLLKTCELLGATPHRTLMIGDSSNDAQAARAAGCPVLLVTYGYNHGEPIRQVEADGFVDSLADLDWN